MSRQDSYGYKHRSSQNGSIGKRDTGNSKTFSHAARSQVMGDASNLGKPNANQNMSSSLK